MGARPPRYLGHYCFVELRPQLPFLSDAERTPLAPAEVREDSESSTDIDDAFSDAGHLVDLPDADLEGLVETLNSPAAYVFRFPYDDWTFEHACPATYSPELGNEYSTTYVIAPDGSNACSLLQ